MMCFYISIMNVHLQTLNISFYISVCMNNKDFSGIRAIYIVIFLTVTTTVLKSFIIVQYLLSDLLS